MATRASSGHSQPFALQGHVTRFSYTDAHQRDVCIKKKGGRRMVGRGKKERGRKGGGMERRRKGGKEERKETIESTRMEELGILCMVYTKNMLSDKTQGINSCRFIFCFSHSLDVSPCICYLS